MSYNGKRLFIVDTDAGVDDAQAIIMILRRPDIEVLALTTVRGNTTTDQVTKNVLRLLKLAGRLDVKVYKGAAASLINANHPNASYYHGYDGFGDVPDESPPDISLTQREHAVTAIQRLVDQYPGQIELICLGPLTNVALILRLQPDFGSKLKHCYVMGGNYLGKGNITVSAEFNFFADPESASVVLNELGQMITLVTWEICIDCELDKEFYTFFTSFDSDMARFVKEAEENAKARRKRPNSKWTTIADQLLAAVAIDKSIVTESRLAYCTIELAGTLTRGQVVVDWKSEQSKKANVNLVLGINKDRFAELMLTIVNK